MGASASKAITTQAPTFTGAVLATAFVLAIALMLSVISLINTQHLSSIRCSLASGIGLQPPVVGDLGSSIVKIALGSTYMHYRVSYRIPAAEGAIESVYVRGPLAAFGVDASPDAPVALTLCGGEVSCADREATTCTTEGLGGNCGELAGMAVALDTVTPDVPVRPNGRLSHLTSLMLDRPELFYIEVSTTSNVPAHRAPLGAICPL